MRALVVALLVVALGLAGCLGGDDEVDSGDDGGPKFSDETGSLAGSVRDAGLEPIVGATVRLVKDGELVAEGESRVDGSYAVNLVPPGEYRAQVGAICCRERVEMVTIVAGGVSLKDFQLNPIPFEELKTPYATAPQEWTGIIHCAVGEANVCQDNERKRGETLDPGIKTVTVALDWEPNTLFGAEQLTLIVKNRDGGEFELARETGEPGMQIVLDDSVIENEQRQFQNYVNSSWAILFEVEAVDPTYEQPFTIWWTFHYWSEAPAGYRTIPE